MDLPPLFARLPLPLAEHYSPETPWNLLGDPLDELLAELPSERLEGLIEPGVHLSGDRIVIEKGARIRSGAVIHGPVYIGEDCEIRSGAILRGGVWLDEQAIVGANTEVKRAIFLEKACRIQLLASASGDPSWSSDEEAREKYDQIYTPHRLGSMWDYFVRRAKRLAID